MGLTYGEAWRLFCGTDGSRFKTVSRDSKSGYRLGSCKALDGSLVVANVRGSFTSVVSDQDAGHTESTRA